MGIGTSRYYFQNCLVFPVKFHYTFRLSDVEPDVCVRPAPQVRANPLEGVYMELAVGDLVVLPGCGVGEVEGIEKMTLEDTHSTLVRIELAQDRGRYWVPLERVAEQGVRRVVEKKRVGSLLERIEEFDAPERRGRWNQRQRRYTEMIMSNRPRALAELVGELADVRSEKTLSFTEKRMFERAMNLLVGELAAAAGVSDEEMQARVEARLEPPAA